MKNKDSLVKDAILLPTPVEEEDYEDYQEQLEEEDEQVVVKTGFKKAMVVLFIVVVVALGGFILWSAFVPLDQGVPAPGVVAVSAQRKEIQHLTGGVVKQILVKDGDHVNEGDPLIILDDSQARAQLGTIRTEYLSALILEARLSAERMERNEISLPPEVVEELPNDKRLQDFLALQKEILKKRRESLNKNLQIIRQNIKELETYVAGLEQANRSRSAQIEAISQQARSIKPLVDEGYVPRNRYLDLQRVLAEVMTAKEAEMAQIARVRQQIAELNLKMEQEKNNYMKEVEDAIGDAHKKVEALKAQYEAAKQTLEWTTIRAPIAGTVMGLTVHTIGGVIQSGHTIMEIVPDGSDLIIEAYVEPQHIEGIYPELDTYVRFSAIHGGDAPNVDGKVIYVSPDRMIDKNNKPFYLVRISVPYEEISRIQSTKGVAIRPGMPVDVIIRTGERTLLEYVVRPIKDRMIGALKER